jgi:hypothetical protein
MSFIHDSSHNISSYTESIIHHVNKEGEHQPDKLANHTSN